MPAFLSFSASSFCFCRASLAFFNFSKSIPSFLATGAAPPAGAPAVAAWLPLSSRCLFAATSPSAAGASALRFCSSLAMLGRQALAVRAVAADVTNTACTNQREGARPQSRSRQPINSFPVASRGDGGRCGPFPSNDIDKRQEKRSRRMQQGPYSHQMYAAARCSFLPPGTDQGPVRSWLQGHNHQG